jgi:hypothetical protein
MTLAASLLSGKRMILVCAGMAFVGASESFAQPQPRLPPTSAPELPAATIEELAKVPCEVSEKLETKVAKAQSDHPRHPLPRSEPIHLALLGRRQLWDELPIPRQLPIEPEPQPSPAGPGRHPQFSPTTWRHAYQSNSPHRYGSLGSDVVLGACRAIVRSSLTSDQMETAVKASMASSNHPADAQRRDCSTASVWPNAETPNITAEMKATVSPEALTRSNPIQGAAVECSSADRFIDRKSSTAAE